MNIVRSVLAVIAGYIVFWLCVLVAFWAMFILTKTFPFIDSALVILPLIVIFASLAGYVTALIGRKAELLHTVILGTAFLVYAVYWVISNTNILFLITGVLQFIGAIAGGYLRKKLNSPKLS